MNIHQKINSKGNMSKWFTPKSFSRHIIQAMKTAYAIEEKTKAGNRLYFEQDRKTNYTEPNECSNGEAWSGGFADNH